MAYLLYINYILSGGKNQIEKQIQTFYTIHTILESNHKNVQLREANEKELK